MGSRLLKRFASVFENVSSLLSFWNKKHSKMDESAQSGKNCGGDKYRWWIVRRAPDCTAFSSSTAFTED